MHRADPGSPQVPAGQLDREPDRAVDPARTASGLRALFLLVIPIALALVTAYGFRALSVDTEAAARVTALAVRQRTLVVRMGWNAHRALAGERDARASLESDQAAFAREVRALQILQPVVHGRPSAQTVALQPAIEQVLLEYDRLRPALVRLGSAVPGTPQAVAGSAEVQLHLSHVESSLDGLRDRLGQIQANHRQFQWAGLEGLILLQGLCALVIGARFWGGVKRARLREAELRRLAQVASHTSSGLAMADPSRRLIWANEACALLTMCDARSLPGSLLEDWLAGATDVHGRPVAFTSAHGIHCEARLGRPPGTAVWVDLEVVPVRDPQGGIEHFAITLQDITGGVQIAQALQDSDARFRSALEAMQEGLVVHANDATIEICNPAAERILGLTRDQMCGRTSLDPRWRAVHEDGTPFPGETHPAIVSMRTGVEQRGVIMGVHKPGGELTWISIDTGLIKKSGENKPHKVVCTFSDITAQRAAGQTLRNLTRVVEQSPTAVLITDANARIEFVNRAFTSMSGYTADEVVGRDPRLLSSGRTPHEVYESMWAALRSGHEWRREVANRKKDGTEFVADLSIFPLRGDNGGITHFVALEQDVTERRQREGELAAARAVAVAAARAKSEFVQNMSHELRTPMNGILGMAELLLQSPLAPAQRNDLMTIRQSAEQQLAVLSQLFDLARLGSSEEPVQHTPFALRACLREVSDKLAADTAARGLDWDVRVGDDVPDALIGDAGCLRQVLLHLLNNAVKFTEAGSVRLAVQVEEASDAMARLRLSVQDSGVGIPADRHAAIFEAFQQGDGSRTRRYGGIGLGLTLASQLVVRMGGTLEVESEVDHGTTFTCHLPFGRTAALSAPQQGQEALAGIAVLVLDGGGAERTGIAAALERWGAQVRIVPGPEGALAHPHAHAFLIIDERGGGFDAFAAAADVADASGEGPPLVVLAAQHRAGDAERCAQLGVAGLLAAPSRDDDLRELLLELLQHPGKSLVTGDALDARRQPRVLVVEDNAVNRKVATRLLERSGYHVQVAVHGLEALARLAAESFDLVLMDIQMPEMDGLEATRHIRASEQGTGRHLPVIALTAHALGSDREAALAAGMDDLVTKPIRTEHLLECIRTHTHMARPSAPDDLLPAPRLDEVLDWAEALERMDGDEAMLHELLQLFVQDSPNMLKRIEDARCAGDLHALERAAHGLKGASATISACAVAQLARRVEMLAREGQAGEAHAATARLEHEMQRLIAALQTLDEPGRRAA